MGNFYHFQLVEQKMFVLKPPRDVLWAVWHEDMNKHFLERSE